MKLPLPCSTPRLTCKQTVYNFVTLGSDSGQAPQSEKTSSRYQILDHKVKQGLPCAASQAPVICLSNPVHLALGLWHWDEVSQYLIFPFTPAALPCQLCWGHI